MADINTALVAALGELTQPVTDEKANTGQYAYAYLSLPGLITHVKPVLAKHGLAFVQNVSTYDGWLQVETILLHATGEMKFGPLSFPLGNNPQQSGSSITYARRYALAAALGIAAEEDDDGAKASRPKKSGGPTDTVNLTVTGQAAQDAAPSVGTGPSDPPQGRVSVPDPSEPEDPTVPHPHLGEGAVEDEGSSGSGSFLTKEEQKAFAKALGGQTIALGEARKKFGERVRSLGDVTRDMALELIGERVG